MNPAKQTVDVASIQNNNLPSVGTTEPSSGSNSHPPSMYSYNDSSGTGTPSDRPKAYCTEGTPTCFSRASSLSSLHSSEADNDQSSGNNSKGNYKWKNVCLQSFIHNLPNNGARCSSKVKYDGVGRKLKLSFPTVVFRIENRTIIKETMSILAIYDSIGFLQTIGSTLVRGGALNRHITVWALW